MFRRYQQRVVIPAKSKVYRSKSGIAMRIALIHSSRHSMAPAEEAFQRLWPKSTVLNILDDSLSADLAYNGVLTSAMHRRFLQLVNYALMIHADGVLFTCSAFGPCIDECKIAFPSVPIVKPNEAMIDEARATGETINLLATFAPTLDSMADEFKAAGCAPVATKLARGALDAMNAGDVNTHDDLAVGASKEFGDRNVIALAQFSLARAAPKIAQATNKIVLTTPDSAVKRLKGLLGR
jgi:hypothetical protein